MQVSLTSNTNFIQQNIEQKKNHENSFDIMYNQLDQQDTEEMIDSYKADLLAKLEETPNSSVRSSDILNLILKIK